MRGVSLTREREQVSERALFYAYRNDPAVLALRRAGRETARRPCACRGVIEADPVDPQPGVQLHNEGNQHRSWRRSREDREE